MMRALIVVVIMSQMGVIFGVNEYCGYARSTDTFFPTVPATLGTMLETLVTKPPYHGLPTSHRYNSHGLNSNYHVHSDLLHVADDGQITLTKANHAGVFGSTSSVVSAASEFCAATGDLPHSADVNGDGRDDLICRLATDGSLQVKYNLRNGYTNPAVVIASGFVCVSTSQLLIGDFDGNHVEDFLCIDPTATAIDGASSKIYFNPICSPYHAYHYHHRGRRHIGYGGYGGYGYHPKRAYFSHPYYSHGYRQYPTVNAHGMVCSTSGISYTFPAALSSCEPDAADILIGDVNGDGKDDLICHHLATSGTTPTSISFSLSQGVTTGNVFATTMTDIAGATCDDTATPPRRVLVANVDGDSGDDLVCVDKDVSAVPGAPTIAFSAAGTYTTFDPRVGTNCLAFCDDTTAVYTGAATYVVGDYNGDHYDDIMCRFPISATVMHTDFIFAASP